MIIDLEQAIATQSKEILVHQADIAHLKFQLDDLRRCIFQSKSERLITETCPTQYAFEFAVNTDMVAAVVDMARIKIAFERKKTVKEHGRRRTADDVDHR